jgi:hypothetical protein
MRRYTILFTLLSSSMLFAQQNLPHPYAFAGAELMGGGYSPLAAIGGAGFRIDAKHFLLDTNGWYDNGHKTNDNNQPNPKGHDRGLAGSTYYRLSSGWFMGAGARWSELLTTNYKKSAWRPTFGGGKDYIHQRCALEDCITDFSMRIGVDYVLPGSDWTNGSQGPLVTIYIPSPSVKAHIFYRETVGMYRFHDTVTDRTNAILTREQMSHHSGDAFSEFTVMYRF